RSMSRSSVSGPPLRFTGSVCALVEAEEVVDGARARIVRVAGVLEGELGEARERLCGDADLGEPARKTQRLTELAHRARALEGERLDVALAHAEGAGRAGDARLRHHAVELDDGGEAERVGEPVVDAELSAQRVRHRMAGAEALLEGDGAHHRRLEHRGARLDVVSVAEGSLEV